MSAIQSLAAVVLAVSVRLQFWPGGWCCTCWGTLRVRTLSWQVSWQASTETRCQAPKVLFLS